MTVGVVLYFLTLFFLTRFGFYQPPMTFGLGREYVETACLLIMLVSTVGLLTYLNMKSLRKTVGDFNKEIAERKLAEMALHLSEEKYRTVANFTYDWEAWRAPNGTYRYISPSCERITGHTVEEFLADPELTVKITHPDDQAKLIEHEYAGSHGVQGEVKEFDFRIITPDGRTRWINHSCTAVYGSGGQWLGQRLSNRDITERKQAEKQIAALALRYQTLLQTASDGIHILDTNGNVVEVNEAFCNMLGYTREEMFKLNVADWDMQLPREKLLEDLQEFILHPTVFETTHRRKDGTIMNVEINNVSLTMEGHNYLYAASRDITQRKKIENKIQEQVRLLDLIFDHSPDGIVLLDKNYNFIRVSETYAKLCNRPLSDFIGRNHFEMYPSSLKDEFDEAIQKNIIYTSNSRPFIFPEHPDWGTTYWDLSMVPIRNTDNMMELILFTLKDVTERKRAEEALSVSEDRYRDLVENSSDLISTHDLDGNILSINNATIKITGYSKDEIINMNLRDIIQPEYLRLLNGYIDKIKTIGEAHGYMVIKTKTGEKRIWEYNNTLRSEGLTKPIVRGMTKDITERKLAESSLRKSELRFKQVSENSSEWIWEVDRNGLYTYVSPIIKELLGYEVEEVIGIKYFHDFFDPEKREVVKQAVFEAFARKESFKNFINCDIHKDGRKVILSTTGFPLIDKEGNLTGYRGVDVDITERMRTEEEIKLKNEQLIKLNSEKDKFFSIIAHDLRSPFQGFMGMTEMMAENIGEFSIEQIVKFIGELNKSAENLYMLLQNLLDWAQLKKGSFSFTQEEFLLSKIVSASIEQINKRAIQKGITIINEVSENQKVFGDGRMINSILGNLLSNAVKFTRKEGKVTVKAKTISDGMVEIAVKDTGMGMSESTINKLFKIDEKVGRKGTEGELSTGLGLLLCKEFVEKHGGRIWAESEEGKGSTLYFTLPESNSENN